MKRTPYRYAVGTRLNVMWTGDVDEAGISAAFGELGRDPGFSAGMDILWCLDDSASIDLAHGDIRRLAMSPVICPQQTRVALVAPRPEQFGLCRIYQAYLDEDKVDCAVFATIEKAEDWLEAA